MCLTRDRTHPHTTFALPWAETSTLPLVAMNLTTEFRSNPLNKIVGLSVILSMGFLLVILAAIYGNWFPIIDGLIFAVAYLPALITRAAFDNSDYDFNFDPQTTSQTLAIQEAGKFLTGFLVLTGFSLPILLHHSLILTKAALVLTIIGGGLIFGTVYTFSKAFDQEEDNDDLGGGVI